MSSKRPGRGLRFWLPVWGPAAVCVLAIALESQQNMGAAETSTPLRALWSLLFGEVSDARWGLIHIALRKSGHLLGYAACATCFFRSFYLSLKDSFRSRRRLVRFACAYALLATLTLSTLDEYHQSFLPGRTSSPADVAIDMAGALLAQGAIALWLFRRRPPVYTRPARA